MKRASINIPFLLLVLLLIPGLFYTGLFFSSLETDIVSFLPQKNKVFSDATSILQSRLSQDRIIVDIALKNENPDILVECSDKIQHEMKQSGIFQDVGFDSFQKIVPSLIPHVLTNLPALFSKVELREHVAPLLDQESIKHRLKQNIQEMHTLDGLGQAQYVAQDPLGLKNLVLSRLGQLNPVQQARFYKGEILSPDGKHVLVIAQLSESATNTVYARKVEEHLNDISRSIEAEYAKKGIKLNITPMGSYRAALDNERIIRNDVSFAIILASCGIILLLLFVFHRPLIGLFAFLPALGGTAAAFFVLSLIHDSISLLVLGFGGAIISITVDHGIAYLLFMDRSQDTYGRYASREIFALGIITALTTIGAFSALCLTNFPLFVQLGQFSALGIGFSFLFVHSVFPHIFPALPAAQRRFLPFRGVVERLFSTGTTGVIIALGFALLMLFYAEPGFNVDLGSMNTVSSDTRTAEETIKKAWGSDYFSSVHLMTTGESIQELQKTWDSIYPKMQDDLQTDVLRSGFIPAMIFPGSSLKQKHINAWIEFWSEKRISRTERYLKRAAKDLGYKIEAFDPFLNTISKDEISDNLTIPKKYFSALDVHKIKDNQKWAYDTTLKPGKNYDASTFYDKYKTKNTKIFDPTYFSKSLGQELRSSFMYLLLFIGISVFLLVLLFFLDLRLTLIAFLPVLFSLICTLGTLSLLGYSIGIPGLMLSIVIFGMGIDYSLLLVRSFQRYGSMLHPNFQLIRIAVIMAAISSCIGFGVLIFAEHSILQSAGLTSFLGITYSLIGAVIFLPFLFNKIYWKEHTIDVKGNLKKRVMMRYKNVEAYPRLFARFKIALDSMFLEIQEFIDTSRPIRNIMDIGCGFAVPACALLEWFPQAHIYCIDPSQERCRVASRVLGRRGSVECSSAPNLPQTAHQVDIALMIDMIHYINDYDFYSILQKTSSKLKHDGLLLLRAIIPPQGKPSWTFKLAAWKRMITKETVYYRNLDNICKMLTRSGFQVYYTRCSPQDNQESMWIIAKRASNKQDQAYLVSDKDI